MDRILSIMLEDTLPCVFEHESIPPSEIWRHNVTLERGKNYLIEAASGTGKSSLCSFIFGLRKDYLGKIQFRKSVEYVGKPNMPKYKDLDVNNLKVLDWQDIRRKHIAYLPQELALFPELTALENIRLKNDLEGSLSEKDIREMLEEFGISHRTHQPVGRMSIGQQQRVAIIRALAQPFDFILLDEPVSHLDEENNRIAAAMVERIARKQRASIVATSVGNPLLLSSEPTILRL